MTINLCLFLGRVYSMNLFHRIYSQASLQGLSLDGPLYIYTKLNTENTYKTAHKPW